MAYSKNGETRVLKFSGPNVLHQGVATGKADLDNAKSVGNMIPVVKKYNKKPEPYRETKKQA